MAYYGPEDECLEWLQNNFLRYTDNIQSAATALREKEKKAYNEELRKLVLASTATAEEKKSHEMEKARLNKIWKESDSALSRQCLSKETHQAFTLT